MGKKTRWPGENLNQWFMIVKCPTNYGENYFDKKNFIHPSIIPSVTM